MANNVITNLKVRFGTNTKKFKKDLDRSGQHVKQFARSSKQSMAGFASAFSGQTSMVAMQAQEMGQGVKALGGAFKSAAGSGKILTRAMKLLKVALASTGIGALVVALGSLVAYFQGTARGAYRLKVAMSAIQAGIDVLKDRLIQVGEGLANFFANIGKSFVQAIKGNFSEAGKFAGQAMESLKNAFSKENFKGIFKEIKNESQEAMRIQREMNEIERERIELRSEFAKNERDIEQMRADARKIEEKDPEKALQLTKKALNIELSQVEKKRKLQKRYVELLKQQQSLGENQIADNKALAREKEKLYELQTDSAKMQRRLNREVQRYKRGLEEAKNVQLNETATKAANVQREGGMLPEPKPGNVGLSPVNIGTEKMDKAKNELKDFKNMTQQINAAIEDSVERSIISFSKLAGELAVGAADINSVFQLVGQTLGDLAIRVGKIAVANGVAIKAIRTSLNTLNGAVAIAAGAALIAIGSAVKSGLAQVAQGGGGAGGGIRGQRSSYQPDTGGRRREQTIRVEGKLKGEGSELAAVIENEGKRKNIVT